MSWPVTPGVEVQKKKSSDDLTGWQTKTKTVLSRTSFLVNTPEMSDVKFIFKTKKGTKETIVYGHKLILAMASPVFQKMFFNQNPELLAPVEDRVEMKNHTFTAEAFSSFVKFLYTDKINFDAYEGLSMELIFGILNCADYYDVPYLKKDCVKQLKKILSITNAFQILEASIMFREQDLRISVSAFMNKNLKCMLESEEILSLKREALLDILNQDNLDLDECFVLDLALKWAEHECKRKSLVPTVENKRKVLGPVFYEIRFGLLTSGRISELVASNLLTMKESLDILLAIHNHVHLSRTSTTKDGSKFRRTTTEVLFKSKPRIFGQRMALRMEATETKKMEEKWKADNKLEYWKSLARVQADLFMGGFTRSKTANELEYEIEEAGFDTELCVDQFMVDPGEFHVQFLYNPSDYELDDLLRPSTYFSDDESIEIREWSSR